MTALVGSGKVSLCLRAMATRRTTVEIVRNPADQRGFAVRPRRWVVERTLAWLTANRRLARDYERHPEVSEAIIRWAAIAGMARRIIRGHPRPTPNPPHLHLALINISTLTQQFSVRRGHRVRPSRHDP